MLLLLAYTANRGLKSGIHSLHAAIGDIRDSDHSISMPFSEGVGRSLETDV